jgi:hypothetical protein
MRGIPLRKIIAAAVVLLIFGLVRLPLERSVEGQLQVGGYVEESVDLSMMEKLGQGGFAAALGGYRPLVASFYYLKAYIDAMDNEEWGRVDQTYGLITTLQPRNGHYWDNYVWHIGWNAYAWANGEADYQGHLGNNWKASNLRNITAPAYLQRAKDIGLKAVTMVKDDYRLYQRLGYLYEDKLDDPCQGARWYQKGSQVAGAPAFMHNIYAILLSECEGAEEEAYPLIAERYWNPDPRKRALSVYIQMESLEDRLAQRELDEKGIDEVRRLAESEPDHYLHRVALAKYYREVEHSPAKEMGVYEEMLRPGEVEVKVPSFYRLRWALLAAGFPERGPIAYRTLREVLPDLRRRLTAEEEAVVRPLEERLDIPQDARLFPSKNEVDAPALD